jgi:hypothetical protein
MDEGTRHLLAEIGPFGELQRRFVPPEKIRQSFQRRLGKERRYLEKTQPGSDIGPDFDALWQA